MDSQISPSLEIPKITFDEVPSDKENLLDLQDALTDIEDLYENSNEPKPEKKKSKLKIKIESKSNCPTDIEDVEASDVEDSKSQEIEECPSHYDYYNELETIDSQTKNNSNDQNVEINSAVCGKQINELLTTENFIDEFLTDLENFSTNDEFDNEDLKDIPDIRIDIDDDIKNDINISSYSRKKKDFNVNKNNIKKNLFKHYKAVKQTKAASLICHELTDQGSVSSDSDSNNQQSTSKRRRPRTNQKYRNEKYKLTSKATRPDQLGFPICKKVSTIPKNVEYLTDCENFELDTNVPSTPVAMDNETEFSVDVVAEATCSIVEDKNKLYNVKTTDETIVLSPMGGAEMNFNELFANQIQKHKRVIEKDDEDDVSSNSTDCDEVPINPKFLDDIVPNIPLPKPIRTLVLLHEADNAPNVEILPLDEFQRDESDDPHTIDTEEESLDIVNSVDVGSSIENCSENDMPNYESKVMQNEKGSAKLKLKNHEANFDNLTDTEYLVLKTEKGKKTKSHLLQVAKQDQLLTDTEDLFLEDDEYLLKPINNKNIVLTDIENLDSSDDNEVYRIEPVNQHFQNDDYDEGDDILFYNKMNLKPKKNNVKHLIVRGGNSPQALTDVEDLDDEPTESISDNASKTYTKENVSLNLEQGSICFEAKKELDALKKQMSPKEKSDEKEESNKETGLITNTTQQLTVLKSQPQPKPRLSKPIDDKSKIEKQISPVRDDLLDEVDRTADTYQDKKKFWEDVSKEAVIKRMSLHEITASDKELINKKRASVAEMDDAPVPKPRSNLQSFQSISESETETKSTSLEEQKSIEEKKITKEEKKIIQEEKKIIKEEKSVEDLKHVEKQESSEKQKLLEKEIINDERLVSEYKASFISPSQMKAKSISKSSKDSSDSDSSEKGSRKETGAGEGGYISDSGDVENYISDTEIEDRVPQIRERQMSVFLPSATASRKAVYDRSASLPTEDLYEISAQSLKARKEYYEEQIKKEMIEEQLTSELEDEPSPEKKTLFGTPSLDRVESLESDGPLQNDVEKTESITVKDLAKTFEQISKTEEKSKKTIISKESSEEVSLSSVKDLAKSFEKSESFVPKDIEPKIKHLSNSTGSERSISIEHSVDNDVNDDVILKSYYKDSSPSKLDSMEVHIDKSELEDSEKLAEVDQDITDFESKSMDSLQSIQNTELSPKSLYSNDEIVPEITVTLSGKQRRISEESDEYAEADKTADKESPIQQPSEGVDDTVWEVSVQSQAENFEEKVDEIPSFTQKQVTTDSSGEKQDISSFSGESSLSDRIKSESQGDIEKIILDSLYEQKIAPEEAKLIANQLLEEIEIEVQKRELQKSEEKVELNISSKASISDYVKQLTDKGLDQREIELVESVLARRQRELSKLSRGDTQTSSMEITDEDLKYSGAEFENAQILEQQINQLKAEKVDDIKSFAEQKFDDIKSSRKASEEHKNIIMEEDENEISDKSKSRLEFSSHKKQIEAEEHVKDSKKDDETIKISKSFLQHEQETSQANLEHFDEKGKTKIDYSQKREVQDIHKEETSEKSETSTVVKNKDGILTEETLYKTHQDQIETEKLLEHTTEKLVTATEFTSEVTQEDLEKIKGLIDGDKKEVVVETKIEKGQMEEKHEEQQVIQKQFEYTGGEKVEKMSKEDIQRSSEGLKSSEIITETIKKEEPIKSPIKQIEIKDSEKGPFRDPFMTTIPSDVDPTIKKMEEKLETIQEKPSIKMFERDFIINKTQDFLHQEKRVKSPEIIEKFEIEDKEVLVKDSTDKETIFHTIKHTESKIKKEELLEKEELSTAKNIIQKLEEEPATFERLEEVVKYAEIKQTEEEPGTFERIESLVQHLELKDEKEGFQQIEEDVIKIHESLPETIKDISVKDIHKEEKETPEKHNKELSDIQTAPLKVESVKESKEKLQKDEENIEEKDSVKKLLKTCNLEEFLNAERQISESVTSNYIASIKKSDINRTSSSDSKSSVDSKRTSEVVLRKAQSDVSTSSSSTKPDRKSGVEFESSSGESHYQSFEIDSGKSRPCSSDVEGLVAPGSSEYESALTSQDYSIKSPITSTDYHTAVSSLSSKESMKSLDSESSGHLGSIEVSEHSETLVPSASDLEDEVNLKETSFNFKAKQKSMTLGEAKMLSTDLDDSLDLVDEMDDQDVLDKHSKMKRSHEMTFQPEPMVIQTDSPQDEKLLGTSLDEGSLVSISSTSSGTALRTVIDKLDGEGLENSLTASATSLDTIEHPLVLSSEISTSTTQLHHDTQIESITITTSSIDENGIRSVSTQVTSEVAGDSESKKPEEPKKKSHRRQESTSAFVATFVAPNIQKIMDEKLDSSIKEESHEEKKDIDEREGAKDAITRTQEFIEFERSGTVHKKSTTGTEKHLKETDEAETVFSMVGHTSPTNKINHICPIIEDLDAEKHELESKMPTVTEPVTPVDIPTVKVTQHMAPLEEKGFHYPDTERETAEEEAVKSTPQTPSSKSSEDTDQGREYVLEESEVSYPSTQSKSEITTVADTVKEKEREKDNDSPNSDSFEMLEKPDIIDDFVVIEEVAKEASEFDSEGKGVLIQQKSRRVIRKKHPDDEVEELVVKSAPTPLTKMTDIKYYPDGTTSEEMGFEFEDSPPQLKQKQTKDLLVEYDKELEANKKWIEQQFQGDQAAMMAAGYNYDMEFERAPLEDIKEEDINDFDPSSRIGSLGSQKESGGSLGSVKDSYSSTPEYDVLAGRKYFTRSGEHDDISMSSLQEFESLEKAMSLEARRFHHGSQDSSSNGSFKSRYNASKSGQGDDVSVSSLKEFEGLEMACIQAHRIELKAKEEEAILAQIDEGQESLISESDSCKTVSVSSKKQQDSDEEDYEKRMFEIDEIIKQAQTNVERFIDIKDMEKTESLGRGDSIEEVSKVPDLELDQPVKSTIKVQWKETEDVMITSTDSLDLKPEKGSHHDSTDSLDLKTGADIMTTSTDSIDLQDKKKDETNIISSDSLEFGAIAQAYVPSQELHITNDHSSSSTGKDFSSSAKDEEIVMDYMVGSTDSLDPTSSTATHATYQYETDSVFSGSFTSEGSNTMVSSTDTIDPTTREKIDLGAAARQAWFDQDLGDMDKYMQDNMKPYVTEIIEPTEDDEGFSHTIHRKVEFPTQITKMTFSGPDAEEQLEKFMREFDEGQHVQETEEVDDSGNVHVTRIVQNRVIIRQGGDDKKTPKEDQASTSKLTELTKTKKGEHFTSKESSSDSKKDEESH